MCELFGISAKHKENISEYLQEFIAHSNVHSHGWGVAFFDDEPFIEKEPLQASMSTRLQEIIKDHSCAKTAFAHIRYATIGNVEPENCHPYSMVDCTGRRFTLIHNGTIWDYPPLEKYFHIQEGDTDSERILLYIIDEMNQKTEETDRELTARERFDVLNEIIVSITKGNKVNILLYDEELVYVHYNFAGFLHYLEKKDCTIFSTLPLSHENWKPLPFMQLLAYRDGKQVLAGTKHQNEYFESEENIRFLYQIFSNL